MAEKGYNPSTKEKNSTSYSGKRSTSSSYSSASSNISNSSHTSSSSKSYLEKRGYSIDSNSRNSIYNQNTPTNSLQYKIGNIPHRYAEQERKEKLKPLNESFCRHRNIEGLCEKCNSQRVSYK